MRTQNEINRQIDGLKKEKELLPHYSLFGDDNWAIIDASISILTGESTYEDYENEDYDIESSAYQANEWLNGNTDEDLFSPEE